LGERFFRFVNFAGKKNQVLLEKLQKDAEWLGIGELCGLHLVKIIAKDFYPMLSSTQLFLRKITGESWK
jgi:hypothetical protein